MRIHRYAGCARAAALVVPVVLVLSAAAPQSRANPERVALRADHGPHLVIDPGDPRTAIPGRYIVVLNDHGLSPQATRREAERLVARHGGTTVRVLESLRGFVYRGTDAAATNIAEDAQVQFVEQDHTVEADDPGPVTALPGGPQANPPSWGLDRIDQRVGPLNGRYRYPAVRHQVTVYVVDTGVRVSHREFRGRARWGGNFTGDRRDHDCNGHGTHVAGTIAGTTTGVAKSANIVSLKVLTCNNSGRTSDLLAAIEWIIAHGRRPAVVNMSLNSRGQDPALAQEIAKATAAGFLFVVAAGNTRSNACHYSPGMLKAAVTVGATTIRDSRDSGYSNFGSCVTIFAPGTNIYSAWNRSDQAYSRSNGTSMAAPHVAGAAALILGQNPNYTPGQVSTCLFQDASVGRLSSVGTESPNQMLYINDDYRNCAS
ncbi:S8 family peptidase [Luedemannella flava]|uniref:S8 family peptidase n=1 Tax=Luedemannella flava TaxID=349316 RepID=UPI0031DDAE41